MSEPEGITNHPASTEAAEDAKLKKAPAAQQDGDQASAADNQDLPKGMAEKVKTVNLNTMTVNK